PMANGRRRGNQGRCGCGGELQEIFISSSGAPEVWRAHPVAVDGWRCAACSEVVYPRILDPDEVNAIGKTGVEAMQAGRLAEAELACRRIVNSWHGFRPARLQLAEVLRRRWLDERLALSGRDEVALLD